MKLRRFGGRLWVVVVAMTCYAFAQEAPPIVIADRGGRDTLKLEGARLFLRLSDGTSVADFHALVRNISGVSLSLVTLQVTVRKKSGEIYHFDVPPVCSPFACENESTHEAWRAFLSPYPYAPDDVSSFTVGIKSGRRLTHGPGLVATSLLADDPSCLRDYRAALSMDGVARRKRISEITGYGCGILLDTPTHVELAGKVSSTGALVSVVDDASGLRIGPSATPRTGWVVPSLLRKSEVLLQEEVGQQ